MKSKKHINFQLEMDHEIIFHRQKELEKLKEKQEKERQERELKEKKLKKIHDYEHDPIGNYFKHFQITFNHHKIYSWY